MTDQTDKTTVRPPVVAILGHIDHGKSTLLDYIRKSNIVAGEAGGITQHIATYEIEHTSDEHGTQRITFVDTPGHEAFRDVRSRGANVADIGILIVSAEDGVMPQTKEALASIKASGVPFIVAINKIDSPKADVERTKVSLMENEVYLEGNGGDIPFVPISAKTGDGVDDLLSMILLVAELEEFTTDTAKPASGVVVEAHKDQKKGISATVIVKDGHLTTGTFVAGHTALSPVRSIIDTSGTTRDEVFASTPVVISGWTDLPPVGSVFETFPTKKEAEQYCVMCKEAEDAQASQHNQRAKQSSDEHAVIPIIIKTDVSGTGEAITFEISKLETERISFNILLRGTGDISEADMKLASATENTIVAGMGVSLDPRADAIREREQITVKTFSIIYELVDWLKQIAEERRPRIMIDQVQGKAKVLAIFNDNKKMQVFGGKVKEGTVTRGATVRIMRRDEEIGRGTIKELQQQKVKTDRVEEGNEFGAAITSDVLLAEGDHLEAVIQVEE